MNSLEKIEGWKHDLGTKLFLWTNDGTWTVEFTGGMFRADSPSSRIKLIPMPTYEDAVSDWMNAISEFYGLRG